MMEDTLLIVITEFIHNLEAGVFAFMQSAPPINAEGYRLSKNGKVGK